MDFRGSGGVGPLLGGPAGRGGGGAQLVGSMSPSGLRRGWVEVYWSVWCEPYAGGTGWWRVWRWWWCPAGGKHITRRVGERWPVVRVLRSSTLGLSILGLLERLMCGPSSGGNGWWRLWWYPICEGCGLVLLRMLTFIVGLGGVNAYWVKTSKNCCDWSSLPEDSLISPAFSLPAVSSYMGLWWDCELLQTLGRFC
eukprot:scaffold3836_cov125-Isochrysis_galbana.AAC.9